MQPQVNVFDFSQCQKWGVVTTIFGEAPSEAVRRFLYRRSKWCVVVVGDKGKPDSVSRNVLL